MTPHAASDPARRRPVWQLALVAVAAAVVALLLAIAILAVIAGAPWLAAVLAAPPVVLAALIAARLCHRRPSRLGGAAIALVALAWLCRQIAPAAAAPNHRAKIESRWLGDSPQRPWFGGIGEQELVAFGAFVGLTRRESASVDGMQQERRELATDAQYFGAADSMVLDSWLFDRGHYWLTRPGGEGPFPLVMFVHGSGGNFRWYARTLGLAARDRGAVAAFATLGFGHWPADRVADRLAAIRNELARELPLDAARTAFVGLSAGVPGALAAAQSLSWLRPRAIAISGIFPPATAVAVLPRLLLLHGAADERAPAAAAQAFAAAVADAGGAAELRIDASGDHLMWLAQSATCTRAILDFALAR